MTPRQLSAPNRQGGDHKWHQLRAPSTSSPHPCPLGLFLLLTPCCRAPTCGRFCIYYRPLDISEDGVDGDGVFCAGLQPLDHVVGVGVAEVHILDATLCKGKRWVRSLKEDPQFGRVVGNHTDTQGLSRLPEIKDFVLLACTCVHEVLKPKTVGMVLSSHLG